MWIKGNDCVCIGTTARRLPKSTVFIILCDTMSLCSSRLQYYYSTPSKEIYFRILSFGVLEFFGFKCSLWIHT